MHADLSILNTFCYEPLASRVWLNSHKGWNIFLNRIASNYSSGFYSNYNTIEIRSKIQVYSTLESSALV